LVRLGPVQVLPTVLHSDITLLTDREPDVRAIDLLLDDDLSREQRLHLVIRQNLVVARLTAAEPGEVRGVGEAEEVAHVIFSACLTSIASGQRKWIITPAAASAVC